MRAHYLITGVYPELGAWVERWLVHKKGAFIRWRIDVPALRLHLAELELNSRLGRAGGWSEQEARDHAVVLPSLLRFLHARFRDYHSAFASAGVHVPLGVLCELVEAYFDLFAVAPHFDDATGSSRLDESFVQHEHGPSFPVRRLNLPSPQTRQTSMAPPG